MSRFAVIVALFVGVAAVTGGAKADDQPQVTKALAKPLKAAQEALQAKNYPETISKVKEAAAQAPHSAYDDYVINSLLMSAYAGQADYPSAARAIEQIIDTPFLPSASKLQLLKTLMAIDYQTKDYDKAVQYGERARAAGDSSEDTALTIAQAYYLQGKYKAQPASMTIRILVMASG